MRNNRHRVIRISTTEDRCVATYESEFLDATYALVFTESVTGAVAFHRFAQMIENQFGKLVELHIADDLFPMKNRMVADILSGVGVHKIPVS